jgi:hypothetical protein
MLREESLQRIFKIELDWGSKIGFLDVVVGVKGRVNISKMARNIAHTPPSLLGIDRRIA